MVATASCHVGGRQTAAHTAAERQHTSKDGSSDLLEGIPDSRWLALD